MSEMNRTGRGGRAASSFLFKLLESFGTQGISFAVGLVLARLLDVSDYGVLTMLTVFTALGGVIVQCGLNTALIQKETVDEEDVSSVLFFSLGIAAVLYLGLFLCSGLVADYFRMPDLRQALPMLALILFPMAVTGVENAIVARRMAFRKLMLCSLLCAVLSGVVGIVLAIAHAGWRALVAQQLTSQFAQAVLLAFLLRWRPRPVLDLKRVFHMLRFGWKLLVSSLLDTGYSTLRSAVIGKKYNQDVLGAYNRGLQFPELVMNAVNGSIQSVVLPVLSEQQHQPEQMKDTLRRSIITSTWLVMPMMAGLAGVAAPLVGLLLGEKWLVCVPFLQICCIDYAFYPIHTANLQAINAQGRSDVFLKLEIIKKSYGLAILAAAVFCFDSVFAIAWGAALSTLISAWVNASPNRKLLNYGFGEQLRDILPQLILSLVMLGAVLLTGMLPLGRLPKLLVQIVTGVVVYGGLSAALRLEALSASAVMLRGLLRKGKGKNA